MNILILGLPNAGKTSLYNYITNEKQNITHKTIGTTRDWHHSSFINNKDINIYDTPGIIERNNNINKNIKELIKDIDLFLYVIDFKDNNFEINKSLIKKIRKFGKDIILIINKDDRLEKDETFETLGIKNIFFISCSHKLGFKDFFKYMKKYTPNSKKISKYNFSIALFGKTNVGKSTLLNKLVGFDRSLVSGKPKTTTDVVSSFYTYKKNKYLIKDTAGLIKKSKIDKNSLDYFSTKKTLSIIHEIDINIFLIDVEQGFDTQSKKILNLIYSKSNILLFIINKIDLIKGDKKRVIEELKYKIKNHFSQSKNIFILSISTLHKKDIINLKNFIFKLSNDLKTNISTSQINFWLKEVITQNPHSRIRGKEVKFKYAVLVSKSPMKLKIFSNFSKEISQSYRIFLLNNFYSFFRIKSKNIKIIFSKSDNPYI